MQVVLVALYRYLNLPARILHPVIDRIEGVDAHSIFYKKLDFLYKPLIPRFRVF